VLTEAERAFRRTHLCSSEIAHVAGIGPFASPMQVWESKVFGLDSIPHETLEIGHLLEPVAAELFARRTGKRLRTSTTIEHPRHRWAGATPDRLVEGEELLVECKAVGVGSAPFWGEDGSDEIPDHYRAQVEWQLEVLGWRRAAVAALIGTELRVFYLERDPDLARALVEAGQRWWFRHVVTEIPPKIDGTEAASDYLSRRFPRGRAREELADMPPAVAAALLEYRECKATIDDAKARQDALANRLKLAIGESGAVGFRDPELGTVRWTKTASNGVDWQAVAEDLRLELGFAHEQLRHVAPERLARLRAVDEAWGMTVDAHRRPGVERLDQRPPKKTEKVSPAQIREAVARLGPRPDFTTKKKPTTTLEIVR
jgi:putative phage-type endonuclease